MTFSKKCIKLDVKERCVDKYWNVVTVVALTYLKCSDRNTFFGIVHVPKNVTLGL